MRAPIGCPRFAGCSTSQSQKGSSRKMPPRQSSWLNGEDHGGLPWTENEIARFEAWHQIGTKARLALALPLYTALRKSDFLRLGPQHIRDGVLHVTRQKTGGAPAAANQARAARDHRRYAMQPPDVLGERDRRHVQPEWFRPAVSPMVRNAPCLRRRDAARNPGVDWA